jgi:hypothetical protein
VPGTVVPGVKQLGHEAADQTFSSSYDVTNEHICICAASYASVACVHRASFTVYVVICDFRTAILGYSQRYN